MALPNVDVWQFQEALTERLLRWGLLSVGGGAALALRGASSQRGLGTQCVAWGAVDVLLAIFGMRRSRRRAAAPAAHTPAEQARERRTVRRILEVNAGLDVLYVLAGVILVRTKGRNDRFWRGSGWGVALQGLFLLGFDLLHAWQLSDGRAR